MWESLIQDLAQKAGLGSKAEAVATQFLNHVRHGEGGATGFVSRVRAAGFSGAVDAWIAGNELHPVSDALAAELLGTGYLAGVAEQQGLTLAQATDAGQVAIPYLVHHVVALPTTGRVQYPSAIDDRSKPNWGWGLLAVAAIGGIVIWVSSCGQTNVMQPRPDNAPAPVVQEAAARAVPHATGAPAQFKLTPSGDGIAFQGTVPASRVSDLTNALTSAFGAEKISGGFIGAEAADAEWMSHLAELAGLMQGFGPKTLSFEADGKVFKVIGQSSNRAKLEGKLKDIFDTGTTQLDLSELQ